MQTSALSCSYSFWRKFISCEPKRKDGLDGVDTAMKTKAIILILLLVIASRSFSQRFDLGEKLSPNSTDFKFLGTSSSTGVSTYQYIGSLTDKYFFGRKIGDVIIGIKSGIIVTTIYDIIPEPGDVGVPKSIIDLIESNLPYPLAKVNGVYGVNIDNTTISLSRSNNVMTFHKDRIMILTSVKNSLLRQ